VCIVCVCVHELEYYRNNGSNMHDAMGGGGGAFFRFIINSSCVMNFYRLNIDLFSLRKFAIIQPLNVNESRQL